MEEPTVTVPGCWIWGGREEEREAEGSGGQCGNKGKWEASSGNTITATDGLHSHSMNTHRISYHALPATSAHDPSAIMAAPPITPHDSESACHRAAEPNMQWNND